jgi:hypothetical protein
MKTALLFLLLLPFGLFAQSNEPFKKANTIEVYTSLTPVQAYKALALVLQEKGYSIASSDATLSVLSTDAKALNRITTKLNASVRGDSTAVIILKGNFSAGLSPSQIEYRGMKGSPFMLAWDELTAVAHALNGELKYR